MQLQGQSNDSRILPHCPGFCSHFPPFSSPRKQSEAEQHPSSTHISILVQKQRLLASLYSQPGFFSLSPPHLTSPTPRMFRTSNMRLYSFGGRRFCSQNISLIIDHLVMTHSSTTMWVTGRQSNVIPSELHVLRF